MVAKQQRRHTAIPPLSPTLIRETVKKVDKCVATLQELQYTVRGATKAVPFVDLRMRNMNSRKSPNGKFPTIAEEWRRISLPAMLLGETLEEIVQASRAARNVAEAASKTAYESIKSSSLDDPKTPVTERRRQRSNLETNSNLLARRKREKRAVLRTIRSENDSPSLQRAKSKINFKVSSSSPARKECGKENCRYIANRVSTRNRPWVKKAVLFPNSLFHSSPPTSQHQRLSKTKSPVIARKGQITTTPHKFLIIKSPPQVRIKSPNLSVSPTRACKKSPKAVISTAAMLRRSLSPSRIANRLASPLKSRKLVQSNEGAVMMTPSKFLMKSTSRQSAAFRTKVKSPTFSISPSRACKKSPKVVTMSAAAKLRRSMMMSPSRVVSRLMSPLKSRNIIVQKKEDHQGVMKFMSGLKQRPAAFVR